MQTRKDRGVTIMRIKLTVKKLATKLWILILVFCIFALRIVSGKDFCEPLKKLRLAPFTKPLYKRDRQKILGTFVRQFGLFGTEPLGLIDPISLENFEKSVIENGKSTGAIEIWNSINVIFESYNDLRDFNDSLST